MTKLKPRDSFDRDLTSEFSRYSDFGDKIRIGNTVNNGDCLTLHVITIL